MNTIASGECPSIDSLQSYLDQQLSQQQERFVESHIENCKTCESKLVKLAESTFLGSKAKKIRNAVLGEGAVVGEYSILDVLGRGGMGIVYKARHNRLNREFALKLISRIASEFRQRFEREIETLGGLNHPNIVQATHAGEHNGDLYLVMELVEGQNLAELRPPESRHTIANACAIGESVASALVYAHHKGIVHRDIKPSNVLLSKEGVVKLSDFGLAKLLHSDNRLTASSAAMGTFDYMAPEQLKGSSEVDEKSDVYGLGATLFKLLIDEPPIYSDDNDTPVAKIVAIAKQHARPIQNLRPDLPKPLSRLINQMLASDKRKRPSATDVIHEISSFSLESNLKQLASGATSQSEAITESIALPEASTRRFRKMAQPAPTQNHVRYAAIAAAGLLSFGLLMWGISVFPRGKTSEDNRTEESNENVPSLTNGGTQTDSMSDSHAPKQNESEESKSEAAVTGGSELDVAIAIVKAGGTVDIRTNDGYLEVDSMQTLQEYVDSPLTVASVTLWNIGDDALIKQIGTLSNVDCIDIVADGTNISPNAIRHLANLQSADIFQINELDIQDGDVEFLAEFTSLETLKLSNSRVGNVIAKRISSHSRLENLNVKNTEITDEGMIEIAKLTSLKELDLGRNLGRISDRSIDSILKLKNLTFLDLRGTTGIDPQTEITLQGVLRLKELKRLREFWLEKSSFNDSEMDILRAAFPNCKLKFD